MYTSKQIYTMSALISGWLSQCAIRLIRVFFYWNPLVSTVEFENPITAFWTSRNFNTLWSGALESEVVLFGLSHNPGAMFRYPEHYRY
mgnify:CR=1 FL=1